MATETVHFEHGDHQITAVVTAQLRQSDYGVEGSPVWNEVEDIDIEQIDVDGETFSKAEMISRFGPEKAQTIFDLATAQAEDCDWDGDEYEDEGYDWDDD